MLSLLTGIRLTDLYIVIIILFKLKTLCDLNKFFFVFNLNMFNPDYASPIFSIIILVKLFKILVQQNLSDTVDVGKKEHCSCIRRFVKTKIKNIRNARL